MNQTKTSIIINSLTGYSLNTIITSVSSERAVRQAIQSADHCQRNQLQTSRLQLYVNILLFYAYSTTAAADSVTVHDGRQYSLKTITP